MGPEAIACAIVLLALTLYAVWGGADFGAGVWEVNTALAATPRERHLIYRAVGPVWEANHVWLLLALVVMFTCFPAGFGALCRALWVPLLLALVGIVFRGVGYAYRAYSRSGRHRRVWEAVFACASAAAPFFLGAAVGAVASGQLPPDPRPEQVVGGWISPLAVFTAFLAVGVCAYLAAVYLAREASLARDPELAGVWRNRALATGVWVGVMAMAGLAVVATGAPELWSGLLDKGWPLVTASVAAGALSLLALATRRLSAAALLAAVAVASVIWGWGVAQYPMLLPPLVSASAVKAPDNVLWTVIGAVSAGAVIVVPSLAWLLYLFKGESASVVPAPREE